MFHKRSILCLVSFLLLFPLSAQVDFSSGNIRILVDDYDGSISLFRKINPVEEKIEKKTEEKSSHYRGASGTKFGALPDSAYLLENTEIKETSAKVDWMTLLDTGRYTSNSAYYLSYNSGVFKLTRSASITIESEVEKDKNDVIVTYTLKNKAAVIVRMHVFSSQSDKESDSIRVDVTTKNLTDERIRVALKAVFDTYLGENDSAHFSTASSEKIASEVSFDSMVRTKWICSENDTAGIKFLLNGRTITTPEYVILANKEIVATQKWIPATKDGRRFDSLFSYNNSALCVVWKRVYLNEGNSSIRQFYITTEEKGEKPSELFTNMSDVLIAPAPISEKTLSVGTIVPPEKPDVIDAEYVQRLLQYIAVLKANPGKADQEEIEYLSTEVENILILLGQ